jgi:hypothetical protein
MTLAEAGRRLRATLGQPDWLSAIGLYDTPEDKHLVCYTAVRRVPARLLPPSPFEGFPVKFRYVGHLTIGPG